MSSDKSENGSQSSPTLTHILSEGQSTPILMTRRNQTNRSNPEGPTALVSLLSLGFIIVWVGFHALSYFGSASYIELIYQFGLNTGDPQYYEYVTAIFTHGG